MSIGTAFSRYDILTSEKAVMTGCTVVKEVKQTKAKNGSGKLMTDWVSTSLQLVVGRSETEEFIKIP